MKTLLITLLLSASLHGAEPYKQAVDLGIREIVVTSVYDGDTITASITLGRLGRTIYQVHGVRLRLKDVNAFEMNAKDPKDREIAVQERDILRGLLQVSGPITAKLYHQTYDRYECDLFTKKGWVNEKLRALPQNK